jgi:hypothetical protein
MFFMLHNVNCLCPRPHITIMSTRAIYVVKELTSFNIASKLLLKNKIYVTYKCFSIRLQCFYY